MLGECLFSDKSDLFKLNACKILQKIHLCCPWFYRNTNDILASMGTENV